MLLQEVLLYVYTVSSSGTDVVVDDVVVGDAVVVEEVVVVVLVEDDVLEVVEVEDVVVVVEPLQSSPQESVFPLQSTMENPSQSTILQGSVGLYK